ncbi:methyltransferase domain-containing protein [uncultured Agrococcus sp.]|uniref:protein-L-isoaspartate O-methyltransferase family protein n=1 Tax=uncultured Agrococcus sp. TaxID=382258 RepID=UPI0025F603D3|nr:methyltransferase domain-containing protein [uncultured Agrococcus sp.]
MNAPDKTPFERVAAAMRAVPRVDFLPSKMRNLADVDGPLPIGEDQTNSQPSTVEIMLQLLDVRSGDRVLDVGAGSGWTTAMLAHLVGDKGRVLGVERQERLIPPARAALGRYAAERASIVPAHPHVLGLPEEAPFDRILVSAEALGLPNSLVEQLAETGIMVIPVDGVMHRVQRLGDEVAISRHGRFRFVPLIEP